MIIYTMRLKKILLTMTLLVSTLILVSASYPTQDGFKNLKVLPKDISEKDLEKVMDQLVTGLGVDCAYCHTKSVNVNELDFAADSKPEKEIARNMLTMTMEINSKYFDFNKKGGNIQAVTCMTCHRGKPRPELDNLFSPVKDH